MRGKKSGIGTRLRKLLARIQKEFHYPKVYAVRCTVTTGVTTYLDQPDLVIHSILAPQPEVRDLQVDLSPGVHIGHVQNPGVHISERMEDMATQVVDVTCWQKETLPVNKHHMARIGALVRTVDLPELKTRVHIPNYEGVAPKLNDAGMIKPPQLRGSRNDAARFPYLLRMEPMKAMPMKMQIRYRAQVMKNLNLKPNQVDFVGVVPGLPSCPLKLVDIEQDQFGRPIAHAAQTGRFNSFMGERVWVIIQLKGKPDYLTVVLREE